MKNSSEWLKEFRTWGNFKEHAMVRAIQIDAINEAINIAESEMNRQIGLAKDALAVGDIRLGHPQLCADIIRGNLVRLKIDVECNG